MGATPEIAGVLADPRPPRSDFHLIVAFALFIAAVAAILFPCFITP